MARVNNLSNFLTDVASAIKTKKGSQTAIPAANFDTEILALPSQGVYQTKVITINENGQTVITPDSGYDAMDGVQVTTLVPEKQLQSKTYNFVTNQTVELLPDTGYDGFDVVTLTINVPGQQINNQDKTITENGQYTADSGYTGLGTVTVNVPSGSGDVKLFDTVEHMQADPNPREGDLAVVYRNDITIPSPGDTISSITPPDTVVFDTAITSSASLTIRGSNLNLYCRLTATQFYMYDRYMPNPDKITYASSDGITYTRTDSGETTYDLGEEIEIPSSANTNILQFFQTGRVVFEGLYEYGTNSYHLAPTQLTLTNSNQLLPDIVGYGENGVVIGDNSIYNNLDTDTLLSGFFNMDLPTTYDNYLIGDPGNKVRYYKKSASGTKFLIKSKFSKFRELINTYASDSNGSFEYLSMDGTMYFYLDTNKNLKIVDLETEQTTTITLAQPSWYAGENLRFAKDIESILYIKSSDNKLYIYDVKAKQEYSTTVTMSSLYDFRLVYADSNYIMVQSSNSSRNADKPTYVLSTSTRTIIWNANTGTSYMTWSTPSGNWYYQTQNATTLYKWNGSAFQSIRTSNLLVGLHSSTLALEDNNYLYIPCGDLNKIIKYAKSGSESYSEIDIVNNTSVSNLSLGALFIDGDYVWVTNSGYDNNFYFIKCTATINSGVPTFTEVEKIELPVLMYNKYGDNEYKLNCGYGLDYSLSLYNTLVKTTDGFDHYQKATSTSNTVSSMKIGNCNLIRVNESTSSDYDYKCIPKDKRTTYNSKNYDFPLYMLGEDMGTGGPGYDTNLVLDSLDAGGAEQYLGGTPITGISNVGGFDVFNTNGDSILYYVMKTVTATSNMTGFSMNNIKILDNGIIQWIPYGNNTVFDTDDYLECTITCTDAYGNTETDVIIIYNSEEEPDDPGPDDPGPDDPGELE